MIPVSVVRRLGSEKKPIIWVLFLSAWLGLTYLFVVPPWQHYDEPTHFEYAWLISNLRLLPSPETINHNMRLEVAASMIENGFFDDLDFYPNLLADPRSIWIGISQLADPPLYYLFASIPIKILANLDIDLQLYGARIVSYLFYLVTVYVAYRFAAELTPDGHPLQWILPGSIALIPAFTDLMTSVNNDVGATLAFSVFLWIGLRSALRGFNAVRLTLFITAMGICLLTKSTVWLALPLAVLLLGWAILNRLLPPRLTAPTILLSGLLLALLLFRGGDAAFWHHTNPAQNLGDRTMIDRPESPTGDRVIRINFKDGLYQPLPPGLSRTLQNQEVSLGAWIWADQPMEISKPFLWVDRERVYSAGNDPLEISDKPEFYEFSFMVPETTNLVQVSLDPLSSSTIAKSNVFFDGLILAQGSFPAGTMQELLEPGNGDGARGGNSQENLLQNDSGEIEWLVPRFHLNSGWMRIAGANLYRWMTGISDIKSLGPIYSLSLNNLFESFFARFGWGQIMIPSPYYGILALLSGIGLIFAGLRFFELWPLLPNSWKAGIFWIMISSAGVWLQAIFRTDLPLLGRIAFIPSARYVYPAIIPTMLAITLGWYTISRKFDFSKWAIILGGILLCIVNLVSVRYLLIYKLGLT